MEFPRREVRGVGAEQVAEELDDKLGDPGLGPSGGELGVEVTISLLSHLDSMTGAVALVQGR